MKDDVMRVALVSEHASPLAPAGRTETGGQNVYVDALATHLAAAGCDVDVYTRRSGDEPATVEMVPGVTVHHLAAGPARAVARDDLFPTMPEFASRLREVWRRRRPAVVHAHFWMSGWASTKAAVDIPVLQTFHALGTVKRRHQGAADTSPPERVPVERRLVRDVDLVIATCRDEVSELRRLGAPPDRVAVVPCGVGDDFSPFGAVAHRGARHRLVSVSRLVPRKGIADAVRAVGLLRDTTDVELVVAGGPEAPGIDHDPDVAELRAVAAELGVAERVTFVGRLPPGEVAALVRSADLVVCAPWYEPFGIVPVEAMACGVPVVGTAVGGLLDTVLHGTTGLLVEPQRPDQLAAALAGLLADPARRRHMGAAAAQRANGYRWQRVACSVLDVYQATIERRERTREVALA